jgi:hypothetical protein
MKIRKIGLHILFILLMSSCTSKLIIPKKYNYLNEGYLVYASFDITDGNNRRVREKGINKLFFIEKKDLFLSVSEVGEPIIRLRETTTEPIFVIEIDWMSLKENKTTNIFSFCNIFPKIKKSKITVYEEKNIDDEVVNRVEILCGTFLISERKTNYPYRGNFSSDFKNRAKEHYLKNDRKEYSLHIHSHYTPIINVQIAKGFILQGILPSVNYYN